MSARVLLVPGISNSGPAHWQSLWEAGREDVLRVRQRDWNHPVCDEWVLSLDHAVRAADGPPILAAHSLGCLVVAHWAASSTQKTHAILMAAVPDPQGGDFPRQAVGFQSVPPSLQGRRVVIFGSSDDPYSSPSFVQRCVMHWNAEFVDLGPAGHINAASGLGDWPRGWQTIECWRREQKE